MKTANAIENQVNRVSQKVYANLKSVDHEPAAGLKSSDHKPVPAPKSSVNPLPADIRSACTQAIRGTSEKNDANRKIPQNETPFAVQARC